MAYKNGKIKPDTKKTIERHSGNYFNIISTMNEIKYLEQ